MIFAPLSSYAFKQRSLERHTERLNGIRQIRHLSRLNDTRQGRAVVAAVILMAVYGARIIIESTPIDSTPTAPRQGRRGQVARVPVASTSKTYKHLFGYPQNLVKKQRYIFIVVATLETLET